MAIKFKLPLSKKAENKFYEFIVNDKLSNKEIRQATDLSYKQVVKRASILDLKGKLSKNNKQKKAKRLVKQSKNKAQSRYKSIDKQYGDQIRDLIENDSGLLKDVSDLINRSNTFCQNYLEYIGYNKKRKANSKKIQAKVAANTWKEYNKSIEKPANYILMPNGYASWYKDKVNKGWNKVKIYGAAKEKFGFNSRKVLEFAEELDLWPDKYDFSGSNNSMYGKPPPKGSGNGINGHIWNPFLNKFIFFRSSLELKLFLYFNDNQIKYKKSSHVIPYNFDSQERNYFPDIVIDKFIYEIKPSNLTSVRKNKQKQKALKEYCKSKSIKYGGYITESTYDISYLDFSRIQSEIKKKEIKINSNQLERLKNNI